MRLNEKVAVITGAAEGIGRSCALQFAREGAAVVVADRNTKAGEETAHAIAEAGGQAIFMAVDVADEAAVEQLFRHTLGHFGTLDVLVSNAGIGGRSLGDGPVHQCTLEAWEQIMAVNLRGTFLACKHALPAMFERGGSIVTIASVLGLVGTQGLFDTHAYATSKAGIIGLTRNIAAHYAREQIPRQRYCAGADRHSHGGAHQGQPRDRRAGGFLAAAGRGGAAGRRGIHGGISSQRRIPIYHRRHPPRRRRMDGAVIHAPGT